MEHAEELIDIVAPLTVRDTEHACKAWRRNAEAVADGPPPTEEPDRELSFARAGDGALVGRFTLDRRTSNSTSTPINSTGPAAVAPPSMVSR